MRQITLSHDEQQLTAAANWLGVVEPGSDANQSRKVLVVAGAVGSGRRSFIEAITESMNERGKPIELLHLDLDGFEPTGPGVGGFVEFRLTFGSGYSEALAAQFQKLLERVVQDPLANTSTQWAVCFALLLELSAPAAALTETLTETAPLQPARVIQRALTHAAGRGACLVHVPATTTFSDATMPWLIATVLESVHVSLAFSCALGLPSEALLGRPRRPLSVQRFELQLSPEQALARLQTLDQSLNAAQRERLVQISQGNPGRLGRALESQLAAVAGEADTTRALLDIWFKSLGPDEAKLRRVLIWAVACGDVVPILPLLAAGELSQADAERFIDRVDDDLCGPDAAVPLFDDLAYRHPGFPGLSVYRFRDSALRAALLDDPDPPAQLEAERVLLQFLGARMVGATRSIAQLFVNLCERVQFQASAGPRQRLRLWVGPAEQAELQTVLSEEVSAGRLPAEALLRTALQDQTLPVHPRLALLEAAAIKESELPHERQVMLASLRTELLCGMTRFADALVSAERGFELLSAQQPEPAGLRGLLMFLRANCQRQLGQVDAALESFKLAAEDAAKPRPDGSVDLHNHGVCLAEAGHCHAERNEWAPAVALLREGIASLKQCASAGDKRVRQEQVTQLEHNLSVCEAKLQETAATPAG
ncbi:MAG: hypothetical protein RL701_2940 [Pseudomonadota bacterium]